MVQKSPSVARVADVLQFLAEHPDQAFTLSQISKALQMSNATCHNFLIGMVEEGFVYRTAAKTYLLGPALARLATTAFMQVPVMQVCRPEMRVLADTFGVACTAYFLDGDDVAVRARAHAASHLGWNKSLHLREPFQPPIGLCFVAWAEQSLFEAWLAKANPVIDIERRAKIMAAMTELRTRGFTYGVRCMPLTTPESARELQNRHELTDYFPAELEADKIYDLAFVTAPVFAGPATVSFALSLAGFANAINGATIATIGVALKAACDRIGVFMAGRIS